LRADSDQTYFEVIVIAQTSNEHLNAPTCITEEIYVTLYEVRSNDKDQNPDDFPKIYTSYCTEKNTYELKEIPGVHASNPSRSGLQLLVAALKLPQEKLEYYVNVKD
jgi:hypothetical protein